MREAITDPTLLARLNKAAGSENMPTPINDPKMIERLNAQSDEQQQKEKGLAALTAFNTGVNRITRGLTQPLVEGKQIFGKRFAENFKKAQAEDEAQLAAYRQKYPGIVGTGELVGMTAPTIPAAIATRGIAARGILPALGVGAAEGAATGASLYTQPGESRALNAAIGGAAGLGGAGGASLAARAPMPVKAALGGLLGAGIGHQTGMPGGTEIGGGLGAAAALLPSAAGIVGRNLIAKSQGQPTLTVPETFKAQGLLRGVDLPEAEKGLAAAQRLGLSYLTPAEATGSPIPGKAQGRIGRTDEGGMELFKAAQGRLASEKAAIDKLLENVAPSTQAFRDKEDELYTLAKQSGNQVDIKPVQDLLNQKLKGAKGEIATALSRAGEYLKPAGANEGLDTSIEGLHQTKMAIDSLMDGTSDKSIGRTAQREVKAIQDKLLEQLDNASPEYKAARAIARRRFLREDLESPFDKKEITGTNFYKGNLLSDERYNDLYNKLKEIPGAQAAFKDMRVAFKNLIDPTTARTAAGLEKTSMTSGRSTPEKLMDIGANLTSGVFDQAGVEVLTKPSKWMPELKRIQEIKNKNIKAIKWGELLGKIAAPATLDVVNKKGEF